MVVAEKLAANPPKTGDGVEIVIDTALEAGFEFTEKLAGFDRTIVLDSMKTDRYEVGEIAELSMDELQVTGRLLVSHGVGLHTAVEFGRASGMKMPDDIRVFAVEIADNLTVSEEMHPRVAAAAEELAERVRALVEGREVA